MSKIVVLGILNLVLLFPLAFTACQQQPESASSSQAPTALAPSPTLAIEWWLLPVIIAVGLGLGLTASFLIRLLRVSRE